MPKITMITFLYPSPKPLQKVAASPTNACIPNTLFPNRHPTDPPSLPKLATGAYTRPEQAAVKWGPCLGAVGRPAGKQQKRDPH